LVLRLVLHLESSGVDPRSHRSDGRCLPPGRAGPDPGRCAESEPLGLGPGRRGRPGKARAGALPEHRIPRPPTPRPPRPGAV